VRFFGPVFRLLSRREADLKPLSANEKRPCYPPVLQAGMIAIDRDWVADGHFERDPRTPAFSCRTSWIYVKSILKNSLDALPVVEEVQEIAASVTLKRCWSLRESTTKPTARSIHIQSVNLS